MTWFYNVSHPVMKPKTPGRLPRPTHKEVLEDEQVRDDHIIDVLSISKNIIHITYDDIKLLRHEMS